MLGTQVFGPGANQPCPQEWVPGKPTRGQGTTPWGGAWREGESLGTSGVRHQPSCSSQGEACSGLLLLLSFRAAGTAPAPARPPGALGRDSGLPQPLCRSQSSFAPCFEVADLSLKALPLFTWGQKLLAGFRGLSWGRPPSGPGEFGVWGRWHPRQVSPLPAPLFLSPSALRASAAT